MPKGKTDETTHITIDGGIHRQAFLRLKRAAYVDKEGEHHQAYEERLSFSDFAKWAEGLAAFAVRLWVNGDAIRFSIQKETRENRPSIFWQAYKGGGKKRYKSYIGKHFSAWHLVATEHRLARKMYDTNTYAVMYERAVYGLPEGDLAEDESRILHENLYRLTAMPLESPKMSNSDFEAVSLMKRWFFNRGMVAAWHKPNRLAAVYAFNASPISFYYRHDNGLFVANRFMNQWHLTPNTEPNRLIAYLPDGTKEHLEEAARRAIESHAF